MEERRPNSMSEVAKRHSFWSFETPPPYLPPRKPSSKQLRQPVGPVTYSERTVSPRPSGNSSRPDSLRSTPDIERASDTYINPPTSRQEQDPARELPEQTVAVLRNPRLQALQGQEAPGSSHTSPAMAAPTLRRHSSLRLHRTPSDEDDVQLTVHPSLLASPHSAPCLRSTEPRPHSHPPLRGTRLGSRDPWQSSPLAPPLPLARFPIPRPRASLRRLTSLDHLIGYREEMAQWKRESSLLVSEVKFPDVVNATDDHDNRRHKHDDAKSEASDDTVAPYRGQPSPPSSLKKPSKFRSFAAEVGFCFSIAMTQFLAEYLITGFAIALPNLVYRTNLIRIGPGTLGLFWPATLLSLILSATLLTFARLADIHGGYAIFMGGLVWLGIWCILPGFFTSVIMLDVSRAMQGLAVACFTPSTFVMVSSFYEPGPRRNLIMGLYSGCAPLGFFAGFLSAGALPKSHVSWYLWIAGILAFTAAITAYLTVPRDLTDRKQLGLKMDWLGAFLITSGLILVSYALAYEPSANQWHPERNGFTFPTVYGPFVSGMLCLIAAVWVEGWYAACPLLPFDFFKPKSTIAMCFACLCFYASYGVWLYTSATYLGSPSGVTKYEYGVKGIHLAIWYTPTAVAGLVLCVISGALMHIGRMEILLLVSGLAWIAAPLLLAVCPLPLGFWAVVLPSMLCATLGIDLTFTISLVRFASTQPKKFQGLSGAVCSILVNLAMSFSLPISEIIQRKGEQSITCDYTAPRLVYYACGNRQLNWGYQSMFLYAAASAGLGFIICVLFVRFSRVSVDDEKLADEERPRETSSESPTLVEEREAQDVD